MLDGLTHADLFAVVAFSSYIQTDVNYLVPATSTWRERVKTWIDQLEPGGGTDFGPAFRTAFDIVAGADTTYAP